jgi:hypothetical protein
LAAIEFDRFAVQVACDAHHTSTGGVSALHHYEYEASGWQRKRTFSVLERSDWRRSKLKQNDRGQVLRNGDLWRSCSAGRTAIDAASATKALCSESALRQQLSMLIGRAIGDKVKDPKTGAERSRFSVELALVNRVFLARSIQTSILEDSTTRGTGRLAPEGAPAGSPTQPASAAADAKGAAAEPDANTRRQNQSSILSHVGVGNSPGAAMDIGRSASSNVLLPDTLLPRPVVVGFKSVRFRPPEGL